MIFQSIKFERLEDINIKEKSQEKGLRVFLSMSQTKARHSIMNAVSIIKRRIRFIY